MKTSLKNKIRGNLRNSLGLHNLLRLEGALIELNDLAELKKLFNWINDPILNDSSFYEFSNQLDINNRRLLDAQVIGAVVKNINPSVCLDIGTAEGHSAALMAVNAPQSKVYTINIPPEEVLSGEGGIFTTIAMEREKIGSYYREQGLKNIIQIIANTSKWEPNIGAIDIVFVDGSHDAEFVFNDTKKVLPYLKSGSFVLWHDFNFNLWNKYAWIHDVCKGVEMLFDNGVIAGNIFHVRDSWVGIYRVP
jgi:hypothetical protein